MVKVQINKYFKYKDKVLVGDKCFYKLSLMLCLSVRWIFEREKNYKSIDVSTWVVKCLRLVNYKPIQSTWNKFIAQYAFHILFLAKTKTTLNLKVSKKPRTFVYINLVQTANKKPPLVSLSLPNRFNNTLLLFYFLRLCDVRVVCCMLYAVPLLFSLYMATFVFFK